MGILLFLIASVVLEVIGLFRPAIRTVFISPDECGHYRSSQSGLDIGPNMIAFRAEHNCSDKPHGNDRLVLSFHCALVRFNKKMAHFKHICIVTRPPIIVFFVIARPFKFF